MRLSSSARWTVAFAALGAVQKVYPELAVVEVGVNNEGFLSGPIDKLSSDDFYVHVE